MRPDTPLGALLVCLTGACLLGVAACPGAREVERPEPPAGQPQPGTAAAPQPGTGENPENPGETPETQPGTAAQPQPGTAAPQPGTEPQPGTVSAVSAGLPADVESALRYDPVDPLADLEGADALDRQAGASDDPEPTPQRGCGAVGGARRVWPRPGPPAIVGVGDGFLVAGYDRQDGREQAFLVHWAGGSMPRPMGTLPIVPPHPRARPAPPGLGARDAANATLAITDGKGALHVAEVHLSGGGARALTQLADGLDARFAPAVAHTGDRTLVAWTVGSTPMRTELAVLDDDGAVLARHDVTPTGMGAAAPVFVAGSLPPSLLVLDPHEGMSPLVRVDIHRDGTPQPGEVALVVSSAASPPELAATTVGRQAWLGYTARGSAATSAVGLMRLTAKAGAPVPLVRGTAYGRLHVAAAAGDAVAIFAADAPTAAGKDPPHRIEVHVVDAEGAGPAYAINAPGGASEVAIARNDAGIIGVAYTTTGGIYVARLRCDDTPAR